MEKISTLPKIVCVVGPTACGKTDLALALAKIINGEIISADSRQIYRFLDAGTAKPQRDSMGRAQGIAYHLVDVVDPGESFDAGQFSQTAQGIVKEIIARGNLPIVAGGTGLYIKALIRGLSPLPSKDTVLRQRLEALGAEKGKAFLHQLLASRDPQAAAAIPPNNIQRVVRALEVMEISRQPISQAWRISPPPNFDALILNIEWTAHEIRQRISARCRVMWPQILAEVESLLPRRYQGTEPGFQSLGYPQALAALRGEIGSDEGLSIFLRQSLAYAKRQRTWFHHQETCVPITGAAVEDMTRQALPAIEAFMQTSRQK